MNEQEIKDIPFRFHTANSAALSAFLSYTQLVEHEANSENKMDADLIDTQVLEVMTFLDVEGH